MMVNTSKMMVDDGRHVLNCKVLGGCKDFKLGCREVVYHAYLMPYITLFCIAPLPSVLLDRAWTEYSGLN